MKKIGNEMLEKGFSIEEHYCSSSNDSLDALVIKELDIGIVALKYLYALLKHLLVS